MIGKNGPSGQKSNSRNTFSEVLKSLYQKYPDKKKRGTAFEKLMKKFFQIDRYYKKQFMNVWLWTGWPYNKNEKDTGIDIVAQDKYGDYVAIQCKFYAENNPVSYEDVSKFFTSCKHHEIKKYIIIHTSGHITEQSEKIIKENQCQVIDKSLLGSCAIDWHEIPKKLQTKPENQLYVYQQKAFDSTIAKFKTNNRGKLIMACGTGKTLTSLRIAEHLGKNNSNLMLYLVPSISLIQQTMREWSENTIKDQNYIAVCSDPTVKDSEIGEISELETAPSTNLNSFIQQIKTRPKDKTTVIFSTYHSIKIVADGLKSLKIDSLDIIFCDEAHRTTGFEKTKKSIKEKKDKDNYYTIVHDDSKISAKRRLYMTATPKVYETKMQNGEFKSYSMDDEKIYGPVFHELSFYDAVHTYKALSDFRVKIAILPEDKLKEYLKIIEVENDENTSDENKNKAKLLKHKAKYAAVWHAILHPDDMKTLNPLQKIITFTNKIEGSKIFAGDIEKKDHASFESIAKEYNKFSNIGQHTVKVEHVDGKSKATNRRKNLDWLRHSHEAETESRIISNAKCLSEGVDVPSLDGIVFMEPKKSSIDVVQSVGRVMRKKTVKSNDSKTTSEDRYGYVILPVIVPSFDNPNKALDDNEPFKLVWQVLNALRSHDSLLVPELSTLNLSPPAPGIGTGTKRVDFYFLGVDPVKEVILYTKLASKMRSKLVEKVGDTDYVKNYGKMLGAKSKIIEDKLAHFSKTDPRIKSNIESFYNEMKDLINPGIEYTQILKMIGQHIILKYVFDLLFSGEFTSENPISKKIDKVVEQVGLESLIVDLADFYDAAKKEIKIISDSPEKESRAKRQEFIKLIYQSFFISAEKNEQEKSGIVYTPIEVIDFINNSIEHVLIDKFKTNFRNLDIKILDPFSGTGAFLSRLIDSGKLDDSLKYVYNNNLFANEYILLAYYVAAVNIETTFRSRMRILGKTIPYMPFKNINYIDTLVQDPCIHNNEKGKSYSDEIGFSDDASTKELKKRLRKQNLEKINIIEGNPPYSRNNKSLNDEKAKKIYNKVISRVRETYQKKSAHGNQNSLHDSYIRSFRWASDRIGECGIIAFICPTSFIHQPTLDGVRACLASEFVEIKCFDLRGNAKSDYWQEEGGKIFGSNSTQPTAIVILVKIPGKQKHKIFYKDIGIFHNRKKKLEIIKDKKSIKNIDDWKLIEPDKFNDWLNKRKQSLLKYRLIGDKNDKHVFFKEYSLGIQTKRDHWMYNSSDKILSDNIKTYINYCKECKYVKPKKVDPTKGYWNEKLTTTLKKFKPKFHKDKIIKVLYKPFFVQYFYNEKIFMASNGNIDTYLPNQCHNKIILVSDKHPREFSVFITNMGPDGETIYHNQCFPLYVYDEYGNRDTNITNFILKEFQKHYQNDRIKKEDIFYYIYGLLNHPKYKKKFKNNLTKELPRIPMAPKFLEFHKIGKKLATLHLEFRTCKRFSIKPSVEKINNFSKINFLKTGKHDKNGQPIYDTSKLYIDEKKISDNIPKTKYKLNGKSPIECIINRFKVSKNIKKSGIDNNPCKNQDIISIIERAIYVGVESDRLISMLPDAIEPINWKPEKTGLDKFTD